MLDLLRQSAVTLALVVILILVNPILTLIVGLTLGITYGLIYIFIRAFAGRLGQKRLDASKWIFTSISEAFGAIKEIKMSGVEQAYVKRFSDPAKTLAKIKATAGVIVHLPRFTLEGNSIWRNVIGSTILMSKSGNFADALPLIALLCFCRISLNASITTDLYFNDNTTFYPSST